MNTYLLNQRENVVDHLIIHCAAINTGQFKGMNAHQVRSEINRWHIARGFSGIGYHGLIMPDGEFLSGRPISTQGAHTAAKEQNSGSLGLILIESFKIIRIGQFHDWFTPIQFKVLSHHIDALRLMGIKRVSGHNDHDNRLCPGFRVSEYF